MGAVRTGFSRGRLPPAGWAGEAGAWRGERGRRAGPSPRGSAARVAALARCRDRALSAREHRARTGERSHTYTVRCHYCCAVREGLVFFLIDWRTSQLKELTDVSENPFCFALYGIYVRVRRSSLGFFIDVRVYFSLGSRFSGEATRGKFLKKRASEQSEQRGCM